MKLIKEFNLKKILTFFLQQDGDPLFNAKGVAFGVFSGCFPFFGFQTLLGVFLAQITKGNIVLAAIATWISNPFTYLPLYFFNFKVGSFLLRNSDNFSIEPNLIKVWVVTLASGTKVPVKTKPDVSNVPSTIDPFATIKS